MDTEVFVTASTSRPGFHRWPDAPDEVAYLRDLHRHMFFIVVTLQVFELGREIEIIQLKRKIEEWWAALTKPGMETLHWSCEQLAKALLARLQDEFGLHREIIVKVLEDNENGAEVKWNPT